MRFSIQLNLIAAIFAVQMRFLFPKILSVLIFFSLGVEMAVPLFKNSEPINVQAEKEETEKKAEENKTEKEDFKDKIVFNSSHGAPSVQAMFIFTRNNSLLTTAYLSLPEIPPDQA